MIELFAAFVQAESLRFWLPTALVGLIGTGLYAYGFILLGRARLMEDMPTSKIRSAAQGYVELQGHARLLPGPEVRSPLSQTRCCWWQYRIEQRRGGFHKNQSQAQWQLIEEARSDDLFLLADDSGECIVDPVGAKVIPSLSRRWQGYHPRPQGVPACAPWFSLGDYRYSEQLLQFGDHLYALGQFASQTAVRADDESRDVSELLALWKRDRRELLQRFDANRDGEIDAQEWEVARRAAQQAVRAEQVERSVQPDLHVLAKPPDRRPFILSSDSQHRLTRGFRWGGLACLVLGMGLGAFAVLAVIARGL